MPENHPPPETAGNIAGQSEEKSRHKNIRMLFKVKLSPSKNKSGITLLWTLKSTSTKYPRALCSHIPTIKSRPGQLMEDFLHQKTALLPYAMNKSNRKRLIDWICSAILIVY